jgi:hypothetical protein
VTTKSPITQPPSPTTATDEATFVGELRRLKSWSGLSFRQLERHAAALGDTLPYSTVATMLGRDRLPREDLLVTFVRACGLDEHEAQRWATVRATIAYGIPEAPASPRRSRWRQAFVAAAVVLAFVGGVAAAGGSVNETIDEQEMVVGAP